LVPEEDLIKLLNQPKVNIDELAQKISTFEDKKRQKIQYLKEEKD